MAKGRRSLRNLSKLLPSGVAGLSLTLAGASAASATAASDASPKEGKPVGERLQSLRLDVTTALEQYRKDGQPFVAIDPEQQLAWWGNWHNGGWHNGGWGNGGWHNGGWGNGGWHNGGWGNGFRNW